MSGAPLIVTAAFAPGDDGWIQKLRQDHYPPALNRVPAHLTLFHQLPPSLETELGHRLGELTRAAPPPAEIVGVMDLGQGTALKVRSEALEAMRDELAEAFHGLLSLQDQQGWRPHVTVQNKVERAQALALQRQLAATLEPRPLAIRALAAWRYLGGPWEPVRAWPFRG